MAEFLLMRYVSQAARRRPVALLPIADLSKVRRVLLVVTTGIGDAVFSSAVFASVRAALPEAEVRLFCREEWRGLFAADPNLDGTIGYPGKFRRFFPTLKALRGFAPELTLVLHGNDPDIIPLCYLAGSRYLLRVPTAGTRFDFLLSNRRRREDATTVSGLHYVENRLRVLDSAGIPAITRSPSIHLEPGIVSEMRARLAKQFEGRPYWVLHLHAADAYKSLPETAALALIDQAVAAFPDHGLVLTGGGEHRATLRNFAARHERVFVSAGLFDLVETAACLAGASAVVSVDTGVLHLAAALDRPVVGLYAPTRAALVGPRSRTASTIVIEKPLTCDPCQQKRCPHRPVKCMDQFEADDIVAGLRRLLN